MSPFVVYSNEIIINMYPGVLKLITHTYTYIHPFTRNY